MMQEFYTDVYHLLFQSHCVDIELTVLKQSRSFDDELLVVKISDFQKYFALRDAPTYVSVSTSLHVGDIACDPLYAVFHKICLVAYFIQTS